MISRFFCAAYKYLLFAIQASQARATAHIIEETKRRLFFCPLTSSVVLRHFSNERDMETKKLRFFIDGTLERINTYN